MKEEFNLQGWKTKFLANVGKANLKEDKLDLQVCLSKLAEQHTLKSQKAIFYIYCGSLGV